MKWIVLCFSVAFASSACNRSASQETTDVPMFSMVSGRYVVAEKSALRSHLQVQTITDAQLPRTVTLPAAVEADPARIVNILAPLTGKILSLKVSLGDRVKAGQIVATLGSGDLAAAWSDQDKARDAFALAKRAAERASGVREAGATADKDLEAAESTMHQAQAELTRTESRLRVLGGRPGDLQRELHLTAPAAGVVTALNVGQGSNVNDLTATLMTIANLDEVFVTANAAESDVEAISVGSPVDITLTAYPGRIIKGVVASANALIEPDTRRQKIRVRLRNTDGALKPNMFASVRVILPGSTYLSVPQSALLMNNDTITVLVETPAWTFERRKVQTGDEDDNSVQILSGLKAGDRVVVKGGVLLND
ncbi:efflux RND transporter periplasmic adaptor subunit [Herbaspirillum sp. RTI4]|uniref:efflux RND transporter periplasmic adaptor subunit n=1 Tax=Herbaspirillum sp. RTI4 TaxID=3048640 RepID=UPI002AB36BE9|nr:efflux RND transporter periplasmic adaptor subunit [Herbaspirillum sp. RTI4]MDY7578883.1 efflux RND transporter periplasmic adaptor subunit [Herbaspirillum sp. RTI4]MEA9981972.1 efflux RND transporter periplasmic adaptor subunit [Herbaspirillum sp. RTI4]